MFSRMIRPTMRQAIRPSFGFQTAVMNTRSFAVFRPKYTAPSLFIVSTRSFSSNSTNSSFDASKYTDAGHQCLNKLQNASKQQIYHWSAIGLVGMVPTALILSPTFLNYPVDFALGIVIPVHAHIGLSDIIEDYVPVSQQSVAKLALIVLTTLTAVGLLKINLCGAGITESIKSLWREPKQQKQLKK